MILKVDNINKTIGEKNILSDVSFEIEMGECVAVIGPNGAGKTTLFSILTGNMKCSSGKINMLGSNNMQEVKEDISILPQENSAPKKLRVKEFLDFSRKIYSMPMSYEEIDEILCFSKEQKMQFIGDLSGGQKRLLLFVTSLIGKPKLLFLDEPTSAMDTSTRKQFWNIVKSLKEKGVTIVYSSHYIEEVEHTADRILLLSNGRLIRDTTPFALKAEGVKKHFTVPQKYSNAIDKLRYISDIEIKKDNISFVTAKGNEVWKQLSDMGCTIEDIEIQNSTLLDSLFDTAKEI